MVDPPWERAHGGDGGVDLAVQRGQIGVVGDHKIGLCPLGLQRNLCFLTPVEFLGGPPPGSQDAGEALVERGVDEDYEVALGVGAGLEEQGRVNDDARCALVLCLCDENGALGADEGVHEGLEALAFRGVGEDDLRDGLAVHAALGREDAPPPPPHELGADGWAVEGLLGLRVGVEHDEAPGGEGCGDGGLAGADAPREPDDQRRGRGAGEPGADHLGGGVGAGDHDPGEIDALGASARDENGAKAEHALAQGAVDDDLLDAVKGNVDAEAAEDAGGGDDAARGERVGAVDPDDELQPRRAPPARAQMSGPQRASQRAPGKVNREAMEQMTPMAMARVTTRQERRAMERAAGWMAATSDSSPAPCGAWEVNAPPV